MTDSNDELMMETMYWWGIPTLFRCEHNKDLSSYLEMYLPQNQNAIKNPSFCDKYKIEWDSYGLPHENISDENCYVNNHQTTSEINQPWFGPGVIYERSSNDQYQWLKNVNRGNIIRAHGY